MNAIEFVVRAPAGATQRGTVGGQNEGFLIDAGSGNEISLNLRAADLQGYDRAADDLLITLADGRVIVLEGYFEQGSAGLNRLFLSAEGDLNEVTFADAGNGGLYAQYGPTESWGKWSPSDELVFIDRPMVVPEGEEQVGMLASTLLGTGLSGLGWGGAAAAGGAALLGTGLIGGGGGDGNGDNGGGGTGWPDPTVDNPDSQVELNGGDEPSITVTGTAAPGSTVTVGIGEESVVVEPNGDGVWEAVFEGENFPADGDYRVDVDVTGPDGTEFDLDGPFIDIDTTPPLIDVDTGTVSAGDIVNAEDHLDGADVTGTVEPGATVVVTMNEVDYTATVDEDGNWGVSFDDVALPGGEYTQEITITATDPAGNSTVSTDVIEVDTIPHPITIDAVGGDNLVNGADADAGFNITGTSNPGAVVTVSFGDITQDVTTAADGTWTLAVTSADFAGGEYTGTITASTVDAAGNASSTASDVQIDTIGALEITGTPVTGDDMINAAEYDGGVTLTGTSEAGSTVTVTVGDVTQNATVGADGSWSFSFDAAILAAGTYTATALVTATDAAGNITTASHSFDVDTEISVTLNGGLAGGDDLVSASEVDGGFSISGTAEPGAVLEVTFQSFTYAATAGDDGSWSVSVPGADIAAGTYSGAIGVTATDAAGNVATASGTVNVDTNIGVAINTANLEGDGIVNAAERADGITLTGTADAGSSVDVTLGGVTHAATVNANGGWSVDFAASELPEGETSLTATAVAMDAAGNSASASGEVQIDTDVSNFATTSTPGGADGVINAAEAAQGLNITGTTEPGATVTVTLGGVSHPATVNAEGSWTVTFTASEIPQGEQSVSLSVSSTDVAGNTETLDQSVVVDTVAGTLTISPDPVETDDVVNQAEASDGVTLRGTSDPGQTVEVTMDGVTKSVVTDAAGNWTAVYAASEVAPGTYEAQITATITDAAGNTLTRTDSVQVDTEVQNFAVSAVPVEGDNIVNQDEASDGIVLSGTTEPGATVSVTVEGVTQTATVDAAGNWTADFAASDLPAGQYNATAQVSTTDAAGNTAETSATFRVDTLVDTLNMSGPVTADGVVNAAEASAGIVLTGQVEAGSDVVVTVGGMAHVATVSGTTWSVSIPSSAIPTGTTSADVLIEATDAAGNTRSETASFAVDTDAPDVPNVESYTRDLTGLRGISIEMQDDAVDIGHVVENGGTFGIEPVTTAEFDIPVLNETSFAFTPTVVDGSHLVVRASDAAGNSASTYLVADDPATSEVAMTDQLASEMGGFNVETIDLQFAEDSHLTITEAQLVALSSNSDTLTVQGGSDDSVTITGAQQAGTQTGADGQTLNVFTLGDATVLIEDDITNVTI